jgi:hypothetical protein
MAATEPQGPHSLAELAGRIDAAGWRALALAVLSAIEPLAMVGQQFLHLSQPLWAASQIAPWARALGEPGAVEELTALLAQEPGS